MPRGPLGRDLERVRVEKAAPSHTSVTHKAQTEKNKKEEADLKTTKSKQPPRK